MIIYNVTIKVNWPVHAAWLVWMKEEHIPDMLSTKLFHQHQFVRLLEVDETEGPTYALQMYANTKADYNRYISEFAVEKRQKSISKWGDQIIAFRSVMQVVN